MTDLITISLGAGLQSSVLVEMVVEGDLPPVDFVIFADTGDEPNYVYNQVEYLKGRLSSVDIPLVTVHKSNMVDDLYDGRRFAALPLFIVTEKQVDGFGFTTQDQRIGRGKRQCTREYKIEPIHKHIKQELLKRGLAKQRKNGIYVKKGVQVESWLGITLDEVERMKPSRTWWEYCRWPLVEKRMTRNGCQIWLEDRSLTVPQKSSCIRCPFHDDRHYAGMKQSRPHDWNTVVDFDDDLRSGRLRLTTTVNGQLYLHRSCVPLRNVDLVSNNGQIPFDFCDAGHCWT